MRRVHDARFATRYFVGHGIDIGCGNDPLNDQREHFPLIESCLPWDIVDGDAQKMEMDAGVQFDFIYSSHCLEHLHSPLVALRRWCDLLRAGGHLVIVVPDHTLYEHDNWPSKYNPDHKWSFTTARCADLMRSLAGMRILKLELLDHTFKPKDIGDQTLGNAECGIELILQKD